MKQIPINYLGMFIQFTYLKTSTSTVHYMNSGVTRNLHEYHENKYPWNLNTSASHII